MTLTSDFRPLTSQEKLFAFGNVVVKYIIDGIGVIDQKALLSSFQSLITEFPILQGYLSYDIAEVNSLSEDIGLIFPHDKNSSYEPLFLIHEGALTGSEDRIGHELQRSKKLIAVELYQSCTDTDRYSVVICVRHIISDAKNGLSLIQRLWDKYTEYVLTGSIADVTVHPITPSFEHFLQTHKFVSIPPFNISPMIDTQPLYTLDGITTPSVSISTPSRCLFSEQISAAIKNRGKKYGLTINSVVTAALVIAEFELSKKQGRPLEKFTINTEVDLRPYFTPPLANDGVTDCLGNSFCVFENTIDGEPTSAVSGPGSQYHEQIIFYGKQIKEKISDDLADGQIAAMSQDIVKLSDNAAKGQLAIIALTHTNWGVIPEFSAPPQISHQDFHGWNILPGSVPLNSIANAAAAIIYTTIIYTSSFHGKISIDIAQQPPFHSADAAQFISSRVYEILTDWAIEGE